MITSQEKKYQVYKTGETPKQAAERQVEYFDQIINARNLSETELINPQIKILQSFLDIPTACLSSYVQCDIFDSNTDERIYGIAKNPAGKLCLYHAQNLFPLRDPNCSGMYSLNVPAVSEQFLKDLISENNNYIVKVKKT
jgi:hypothetical protein